jgi:hypothetical protein
MLSLRTLVFSRAALLQGNDQNGPIIRQSWLLSIARSEEELVRFA